MSALKDNDPNYATKILSALAAGMALRVAQRLPQARRYETLRGQNAVSLPPNTKFNSPPQWVIYEEIEKTQYGNIMRLVSAISPEILVKAAPAYWSDTAVLPVGYVKDEIIKVLSE